MKRRLPQSRRTIAITAMVIVALVVAAALIYANFFAPPDRQDYERAKSQAAALKTATTQADLVAAKHVQSVVASLRLDPSGSKLAADTEQTRKDYDAVMNRYAAAHDELKSSPVARDEQTGKALEAVVAQSEVFTGSFGALTAMYPTFYRAYIACDDVGRFSPGADAVRNSKDFSDRSQDCVTVLGELARTSKVKSIAQYATDLGQVVREQRAAYDSLSKPGANKAAITSRLAELDRKADMLDPVAKLQDERVRAIDTTAIDELVKQLDIKLRS